MPTLKAKIQNRQHGYFKSKLDKLNNESPLKLALDLARSANTASYKIIMEVRDPEGNFQFDDTDDKD